ncbi:MAB_1171c family putative transporter [Allokutzneria sp. NRRL B-24872]|uniref:MAB_1171c family putative transporter n=1 Tax=Allokutzneria sp. NRRL B-24872 TaxID=1137961 RepID=UPI000A3B37C2|nr:MAB_1171c family putative transporter [Allokutzneria sp. NRRL B-24872]
MIEFHLPTCALITGVVVRKLVVARANPPAPGLRHLLLFLMWIAVSLVVLAPETERLIVLVQPMPNTARLLGNFVQLLAVYHMVGIAYSPRAERPPRVLRTLLFVTWATLTVLMSFSGKDFSKNIFAAAMSNPALIAYGLVFLLYATGCIAVFVHVISRYARQCEPGLFRSGLVTIIAAAVCSALWGAWSSLQPLLMLGFDLSPSLRAPVDRVLAVVSVLLWLVGSTMAWWDKVLRRVAAHRGYHAIGPLWTELTAALPRIALTSRSRLPRNVEFALYRRIIEIRDGDLALRPFVPPQIDSWVREAAPSVDSRELAVLVEACSLAAALVSHDAEYQWGSPHRAPPREDPCVESETAWLTSVSRAFTGSPVVAEIRERTFRELQNAR